MCFKWMTEHWTWLLSWESATLSTVIQSSLSFVWMMPICFLAVVTLGKWKRFWFCLYLAVWILGLSFLIVINCLFFVTFRGTGIRGLMRGMANFPHGNQDLLVVKDKVAWPPGEFGVSKSMECDIFPSVLWHCWFGERKGIRPVKNWVLFCWWWWFDWSFARPIAPVVTTNSVIRCFTKHPG